MKRFILCFVIGISLTSCDRSVQAPQPDVSNSSTASTLPNHWKYRQTPLFDLAIALPDDGSILTKETNRKDRESSGLLITSHTDELDPITQNTKKDYFFFGLYRLKSFLSLESYLLSQCSPEGRSAEQPYYIQKTWKQGELTFFRFSRQHCPNEYAALNKGIIFGNGAVWFIIPLPDGDWGEQGQQFFELALHSIRPIESASNSSEQ